MRELFPTPSTWCIAAPGTTEAGERPTRLPGGRPADLFAAFLAERGIDDPGLARLFADVLDEVESAGDEPVPLQHERVA